MVICEKDSESKKNKGGRLFTNPQTGCDYYLHTLHLEVELYK